MLEENIRIATTGKKKSLEDLISETCLSSPFAPYITPLLRDKINKIVPNLIDDETEEIITSTNKAIEMLMEKYTWNRTRSLREKELNSIRNNSSAVKLAFSVCSHIANLSIADLYFDIPTNPLPYVVLYISDSMNRLIWENENRQLHSIHFPFFVSDNGSFLKLHYHGIEIDSQAIQALTRLFISRSSGFFRWFIWRIFRDN